ncbi:hypothetical protein HMN09_01357600 [Mycena chlorophos]|uniref:Uncharacterized protein n=1 Tax=Mycena chlorophos TaxID=658473 RepID=A0A8H6VPP4_MYCCL|nr:hypothetical protein HMN09_01357600 [Mycena chlorophos]
MAQSQVLRPFPLPLPRPRAHFNERGELIAYPPTATHSTANVPPPQVVQLEMTEEDEMELDLQYPDEDEPAMSAPVSTSATTPASESTPPTRSHPGSVTTPPALPKSQPRADVPTSAHSALLCPTEGCNGITGTPGRRCLTCVHRNWANLRGTHVAALPRPPVVQAPQPAVPAIHTAERPKKKKKNLSVRLLVRMPGSSTAEIVVLDKPVVEPVPDAAAKEWDSDLTDLTDDDTQTQVQPVVAPPRTPFKIRIPARSKPAVVQPNAEPSSSKLPIDSPMSEVPVPVTSLPTPPPSATPPTPTASALPTTSPPLPGPIPAPAVPGFVPPAAESQQRRCTIARCRAPLPPLSEYRWKCCTACRVHYRQYQRDRMKGLRDTAAVGLHSPSPSPGPGPGPCPEQLTTVQEGSAPKPETPIRSGSNSANGNLNQAPKLVKSQRQREWEREEMRRALEASIQQPGRSAHAPMKSQLERYPHAFVPGARACKGHACDFILPSAVEYPLEKCVVCARRDRLQQGEKLTDGLVYPLVTDSAKQQGRCRYSDCGSRIIDGSVEECQQCIRRMRKVPAGTVVRKKYKTPIPTTPTPPPASSKKRKRFSPYPVYQSRESVIKDFGTRFAGFIQAQSYYALMRGGPTASPAMFDFSGEYSIVVASLDVVARRPAAEAHARDVKSQIERVCGLAFTSTSWVSVLGSHRGVVTRFACTHVVDLQRQVRNLPLPRPPGANPYMGQPKTMQGELEVAVLPDESHKYFAGEKTIVRFRLVG